ncbi:MAG TPA: zinc ribbon domain-containing protein [Gemmatimonadaceae bacterium]|nr:zinc ribbon domain-containing protein [Gemmatimonadaceae bacterium]
MDNLDRMYRHLVRVVRSRFPQYLTEPFDVATLQSTILPYRLHRRELGLESNDDYEIALTELLSGMRDYLLVDDQMRESLKRELSAKNPDPAAFRKFASAMVSLAPAALRSLEAGPDDTSTPLAAPVVGHVTATPPARVVEAPTVAAPQVPQTPQARRAPSEPRATPSSSTPATPSVPSMAMPSRTGAKAITPAPGEHCRACDEVLPPGRPITFCPHCGQNLTTMNCQACGAELEVGWKFCPVCGRPAAR